MTKDRGENKPDIYGKPEYSDWSNSSDYKQFDRVNYKGAIYAARKANSGVNPFFDDGETWELIDGVAFEANDTMEVETVNGTLVSGRKVNASGGIGSNVTSKGLNIYGMKASKNSYGVVKIGDGINIDDGVISADVAQVDYASKSNAGIIQLGDGLKLENASGLASVDYGTGLDMVNGKVSGKIASVNSVGVVKPDGDTITIDDDGMIVATPYTPPIASASALGNVKIGSGISVTDDGTISVSGGSGDFEKVNITIKNSGFDVKVFKKSNRACVFIGVPILSLYDVITIAKNLPIPKIFSYVDISQIFISQFPNLSYEGWFQISNTGELNAYVTGVNVGINISSTVYFEYEI